MGVVKFHSTSVRVLVGWKLQIILVEGSRFDPIPIFGWINWGFQFVVSYVEPFFLNPRAEQIWTIPELDDAKLTMFLDFYSCEPILYIDLMRDTYLYFNSKKHLIICSYFPHDSQLSSAPTLSDILHVFFCRPQP